MVGNWGGQLVETLVVMKADVTVVELVDEWVVLLVETMVILMAGNLGS